MERPVLTGGAPIKPSPHYQNLLYFLLYRTRKYGTRLLVKIELLIVDNYQ
jgi:hypothetical protein